MNRSSLLLKEVSNLSKKELVKRAKKLSVHYRVGDEKKFRLSDYSTQDFRELKKKEKLAAKEILQLGVEALTKMQDKRYAQIAVASAIINAMDSLNLAYPEVSKEKNEELQQIKQDLLSEK